MGGGRAPCHKVRAGEGKQHKAVALGLPLYKGITLATKKKETETKRVCQQPEGGSEPWGSDSPLPYRLLLTPVTILASRLSLYLEKFRFHIPLQVKDPERPSGCSLSSLDLAGDLPYFPMYKKDAPFFEKYGV